MTGRIMAFFDDYILTSKEIKGDIEFKEQGKLLIPFLEKTTNQEDFEEFLRVFFAQYYPNEEDNLLEKYSYEDLSFIENKETSEVYFFDIHTSSGKDGKNDFYKTDWLYLKNLSNNLISFTEDEKLLEDIEGQYIELTAKRTFVLSQEVLVYQDDFFDNQKLIDLGKKAELEVSFETENKKSAMVKILDPDNQFGFVAPLTTITPSSVFSDLTMAFQKLSDNPLEEDDEKFPETTKEKILDFLLDANSLYFTNKII